MREIVVTIDRVTNDKINLNPFLETIKLLEVLKFFKKKYTPITPKIIRVLIPPGINVNFNGYK